MKRVKPAIGIILLAALFSAFLLPFQSHATTRNAQELCLSFVEEKLQSAGGVFTNYLPQKEAGQLASGHSVLSESQGLMLSYYARTRNQYMADMVLGFIQDRLDTGRILSYRLNEDGRLYPVNAAVDDLRLAGALLEAADVFDRPGYRDQAAFYAKRLYETNVRGQMLADFYDEQLNKTYGYATLCYSDLYAMRALSAYDSRWLPVMENMQAIVLGGYLGDAFPFYQTRFHLESRRYETDNVSMVESLLTAYHLSAAGSCPKQTPEYLKDALRSGKLYSEYDLEGNPLSDTESTAIYALCALIGASERDAELYQAAIGRMLLFQVTDPDSPVYGAFADAKTLKAYSFDNLMALLALEAGKLFR